MNKKQIALIVFLSWNGLGFVTSLNNQWDRVHVPGTQYETELVHSNCVYRSVAGFTNLGYIAACELYRSRFEIGK